MKLICPEINSATALTTCLKCDSKIQNNLCPATCTCRTQNPRVRVVSPPRGPGLTSTPRQSWPQPPPPRAGMTGMRETSARTTRPNYTTLPLYFPPHSTPLFVASLHATYLEQVGGLLFMHLLPRGHGLEFFPVPAKHGLEVRSA